MTKHEEARRLDADLAHIAHPEARGRVRFHIELLEVRLLKAEQENAAMKRLLYDDNPPDGVVPQLERAECELERLRRELDIAYAKLDVFQEEQARRKAAFRDTDPDEVGFA